MQFIIDSANREHINEVLALGIDKVTANTSMYKNCNETLHSFLSYYAKQDLTFLSGEIMGESVEEMLAQADALLAISKDIVIKIDCNEVGLQVCKILSDRGIQTAMTLLFTLPQAMAAIQAGANYLFAFIGRNEEYGVDGLQFIEDLQSIVKEKGYNTKVVAASIKNAYHVQEIAKRNIDYAAIPYDLYKKILFHPLSESGHEQFMKDFQ